MQLTRFDRWLREVFVYETHIRTLRPAESVPKRIKAIEYPESPMHQYRYLYIARKSRDADLLIQQLRENTQMFTTDIVERKRWFTPIVAPAEKSVTWRLVSTFVIVCVSAAILVWVRSLIENPDFMDAIRQARELIK